MKKLLILSLVSLALTGCDFNFGPKPQEPVDPVDPEPVNPDPVNPDPVKPDPEPEPIIDYTESIYSVQNEDEMYKKLYDKKNKISVVLDFTNNALKSLQNYGNTNTIQKDMYHPCTMTLKINDETYTYEEVGARMKGNTSRTDSFVKDDDTLDKSRFLNLKLSFSQTFDDEEDNDYYIREWESKDIRKERKNRRLGGQKKVDLKWNKNQDQTFTKASYCLYAYEQEGIPAQKDNVVQVTIKNEKDSSTFLMDMMEALDEIFATSHFTTEDSTGNLYKSLYGSDGPADFSRSSLRSVGVETPSWSPIYDLKTNDKEPDHTLLTKLINTLNDDKRSASEFKSTLDSMVDVDEFLKYSALSWVIGNPDDMRNNYNNYYTYFRSSDNKLVIIPYDVDRCFGILQDWEIHTENYSYNSYKQVTNNQDLRNPLFYRTFLTGTSWYGQNFQNITEYKQRYEHYCYVYAHKYLDNNKFSEFTNKFPWVNKNVSSGGGSNLSFAKYAEAKLKVAPTSDPFVK